MTKPGMSTAAHRPSTEQLVRSIPFFSCLAEEDLRSVAALITEKQCTKNDVILLEEDGQHCMYLVCSGKVKVVQSGHLGKEQILAIHKKGDFFGEMALLDGKTAPASVIAMEDTTVALIGKEDFQRFVASNARVTQTIIGLLCSRLREAWMMLRVLSLSDAEQRVRAVLDHVSRLYGVRDDRGILLSMKLTHREIADYANVSRETATRLLNRFRSSGEIDVLSDRRIVIKPAFSGKMPNL
jgi:CRP/FNR family transcriptional regulator